jgi:starch-binding outer membrane protein, SusD/RagB family
MTNIKRLIRVLPVVAFIGCSNITEVQAPDVTGIDQLSNIAGADVLRNGAWVRLQYALDYQAYYGAAIGDEFTATFDNDLIDGRGESVIFDPARGIGNILNYYASWARVNALQAIPVMQKFYSANRRSDIGRIFGVAAFSELFMGESMCSGVPLGYANIDKLEFGSPISRDSMLKRALADFDSGAAYAADSARILNFIRVGRARTLQQLNRHAEAAAAVAAVPANYVMNSDFSATSITNVVFQTATSSYSVSDKEGGNGLDYISARDPRVPTAASGVGSNGYTPRFIFTKLTSNISQFPIASGIEARLIEAEALLKAGDASGALAKLNDLRANSISPALPALTDAGSADARLDQVMRERAFWLFGTGHRLGDMRRLVRQYGRATESVFPTGTYRLGLPYGKGVSLTVYSGEGVNPNYVGTTCDNRIP